MGKHHRMLPALPTAVATLAFGAAAPPAGAGGNDKNEVVIPFGEDTSLFFELNDTDGDLGIHAMIDGRAWKRLEIEGPKERELLKIQALGRLRRQGLTELFFESAEPSFDELSPQQFFKRFPEGEYEISGTTLAGDELESIVALSHVMPAPPAGITISGVASVENCDVVPLPSVAEPVVIKWNAVTESHPEIGTPGVAIEVDKYQFVIEKDGEELIVTADLPPDMTAFEIPVALTEPGDEIKFEIIVREANGNQTAVESCFTVK